MEPKKAIEILEQLANKALQSGLVGDFNTAALIGQAVVVLKQAIEKPVTRQVEKTA